MEKIVDADSWNLEADCAAGDPARVLVRIQELFRRAGIFGKRIIIEHDGREHRVTCDDQAFMVYRINRQGNLPPGAPGWTVCQVDQECIFEEGSTPGLKECRLSCGTPVSGWLEIIRTELGL